MWNNVVLLGDGPLFWEVRDYLGDYHVQVHTLDQGLPKEVHAIIDVELNDEQKKKALRLVENHIPSDVPIFSSALSCTATEIASWLNHPERVLGFSSFKIFRAP